MAITRSTTVDGADGEPTQRNVTTSVRRPEPDLHLARLAPGLPARIRDGGRKARGDGQAARRRRTAGCRPGPTSRSRRRRSSASTLTDTRRVRRSAPPHRPLRQVHPGRETASRRSSSALGADGIPNTADDIVIVSGTLRPAPAEPRSRTGAGPDGTNAFLDDIAHNAVPEGVTDRRSMIRRPRHRLRSTGAGNAVADTTSPSTGTATGRITTTSFSTGTSSPATAAATRISASPPSTISSIPSTTGRSTRRS